MNVLFARFLLLISFKGLGYSIGLIILTIMPCFGFGTLQYCNLRRDNRVLPMIQVQISRVAHLTYLVDKA